MNDSPIFMFWGVLDSFQSKLSVLNMNHEVENFLKRIKNIPNDWAVNQIIARSWRFYYALHKIMNSICFNFLVYQEYNYTSVTTTSTFQSLILFFFLFK